MSRARASHILTAGAPTTGLANIVGGVCPVPGPDDDVKFAIRAIRSTVPSLAAVLDPGPMSTWFTNCLASDASLRARFAERMEDSTNYNLSTTWSEFLALQGLEERHFVAARKYLAAEAKAL